MNRESTNNKQAKYLLLCLGLLISGSSALAQYPVDESGNPIAAIDEGSVIAEDQNIGYESVILGTAELEQLVGPIALYPDDLLAIVLPATTYPLEIVQAARFLDQLETDSTLQPDPDWDESVVALLNYPDVVRMLDDDIDWTWELGDAVVNQQDDVVVAVESFRDRAYAAGNLQSDEHQQVNNADGIIEIVPIEDDVIYVPYYEPERVVVRQPSRVYHYYPSAYPVYYYPYPAGYSFSSGYFWGVTTAYRIGWLTDSLHVRHHSYWGHPYFGHSYYGHYYRRPSISIYNSWYGSNRGYSSNHWRDGDRWRPRRHSGSRPGNRHKRDRDRDRDSNSNDRDRTHARNGSGNRNRASSSNDGDSLRASNRGNRHGNDNRGNRSRKNGGNTGADSNRDIRFRDRSSRDVVADARATPRRSDVDGIDRKRQSGSRHRSNSKRTQDATATLVAHNDSSNRSRERSREQKRSQSSHSRQSGSVQVRNNAKQNRKSQGSASSDRSQRQAIKQASRSSKTEARQSKKQKSRGSNNERRSGSKGGERKSQRQ